MYGGRRTTHSWVRCSSAWLWFLRWILPILIRLRERDFLVLGEHFADICTGLIPGSQI